MPHNSEHLISLLPSIWTDWPIMKYRACLTLECLQTNLSQLCRVHIFCGHSTQTLQVWYFLWWNSSQQVHSVLIGFHQCYIKWKVILLYLSSQCVRPLSYEHLACSFGVQLRFADEVIDHLEVHAEGIHIHMYHLCSRFEHKVNSF